MTIPNRIHMLLFTFGVMLTVLLSGVITASAQTVAVKGGLGEQGYGWMFRKGGACYVILPAHVAGPLPQIALTSAAPVAVGTGDVIRPFWPGIDLALAVARGGIESRCDAELADLKATNTSRSAGTVRLHRLTASGEDEWVDLRVLQRDYLTLSTTVVAPEARIYKGTSGAFAFVGGVPVGMAITSDDPTRATLMRAEEIAINVNRFLTEQGAAFLEDTAPDPVLQAGGFALTVAEVTAPAISPDTGPQNILGAGSYVFAPQRAMEILLRVHGDALAPLSQLLVKSPVQDSTALPRRIIVMTGARATADRMRVWYRGEMAPDGLMDSGPRAVRDVRWIKLIIASTWGHGNLAIDEVVAR